jgi:DNA-binding LytR/AlgR family response regulator
VVGEAADAQEAIKLIKALKYDVVFLDIQMSGITGIDLAGELRSLKNPPQIVFVTAYNDYAVDAFAVGAVDYLVKPIEEGRLRETVSRLRSRLSNDQQGSLSMLAVEKDGCTVLVAVGDIVFVCAQRECIIIHTYDDQAITHFTLELLAERLPRKMFFRVHRSYLVNISHIKEIRSHLNGSYRLRMNDRDKSEVPVSRSRVSGLKEYLGLRCRRPSSQSRCRS